MNENSDLRRLARIADSVFAVVVTLLAYRVRLPDHQALTALDVGALRPFLADLAAVSMSFLVASLFWLAHWGVFRRMHRADVGFVKLHFAFLGMMVLLPISTSLMSSASGELAGATAYSVNMFLLALTQTLFRAHARRLEPQAFGDVPLLLGPGLLMLIFGSAAIVGVLAPRLAWPLWCAAWVMPTVERRWGLGRLRQLDPPPP